MFRAHYFVCTFVCIDKNTYLIRLPCAGDLFRFQRKKGEFPGPQIGARANLPGVFRTWQVALASPFT